MESGGWMDSKLFGGGAEGVFLDFEILEVPSSFFPELVFLLLLADILPFIWTVSLEHFRRSSFLLELCLISTLALTTMTVMMLMVLEGLS